MVERITLTPKYVLGRESIRWLAPCASQSASLYLYFRTTTVWWILFCPTLCQTACPQACPDIRGGESTFGHVLWRPSLFSPCGNISVIVASDGMSPVVGSLHFPICKIWFIAPLDHLLLSLLSNEYNLMNPFSVQRYVIRHPLKPSPISAKERAHLDMSCDGLRYFQPVEIYPNKYCCFG